MASRVVGAVALIVLPTLLALGLLVLGISRPDLTLVYASIGVSLLALPAFVGGVLLLVRATRR